MHRCPPLVPPQAEDRGQKTKVMPINVISRVIGRFTPAIQVHPCLVLLVAVALLMPVTAAHAAESKPDVSALVATPPPAANLPVLLTGLIKHHDRITSFRLKKEAASARVRVSRAGFLPSMNIAMDGGYEENNREYGTLSDEWRYASSINASQLITDFGRTGHELDRARAAYKQAEAEEMQAIQEVSFEGLASYLGVIRARNRLVISEKSVMSIKKQVDTEELLRKKGAGLASDVFQARAQLAGAVAVVEKIRGELARARHRFDNVFHQWPDDTAVAAMTSPPDWRTLLPDSAKQAVATAGTKNPKISAALFRVAMAREEVGRKEAAYFPRLVAFARVERLQDDSGIPGYQDDLSTGVRLMGNLFNGLGDKAGIDAAKKDLDAAKSALAFVRRRVTEDTNNAWSDLDAAGRVLTSLTIQVRELDDFLRLARRERKLGTRSLLDVLSGDVTKLNARAGMAAAAIDEEVQGFRLLTAMGILIPDIFTSLNTNATGGDNGTPSTDSSK